MEVIQNTECQTRKEAQPKDMLEGKLWEILKPVDFNHPQKVYDA